ncbi:MAG TPA: ABC-F family ATP-binding cassette domain-containing protein [Candidatus Hydrogenedentes bacterium]|nr:ABC-F family ATP-binding cassette domain-containing protein [Candidatus Hydrogenedentota bacterium]HIJ74655.1 ABC-F family ATP-binding cassette domain-containing protein [Candidatus Hydrogenedentota bacterium]
MTPAGITFQSVSFTYDTATNPLVAALSVQFPTGWTGIVGANGAGKTTILRLATGELNPQQGTIRRTGEPVYCPQRTDDVPAMLDELIAATDGDASAIKGTLGVTADWPERWQTLSHGERKRAQIAVLLWRRPQVLAIDEPTNHIDAEARALLATALHSFQGVGLLVSHDRELLDDLCAQCLFVDPPEAVLRSGGYSKGAQQAKRDEERVRKEKRQAKRAFARLRREAIVRRQEASRAHRQRSKRALGKKDHDAKEKIDMARVTGKDGVAGRRLRQLEGRVRQSQAKQESIRVKKIHELGIAFEGAHSKRDWLFRLSGGSISLGGKRRLSFPNLHMRPRDRVALTGPNGTGKSTLVRHIVRSLALPAERVTYVPQEIDLESSKDILARVRALPKDKLGQMMAVVSRLGSRPHRLLDTDEPSPGEVRKVLLALGITQAPHLIIMDEPTNHMDLPSITCLEDALDECPCGLLLVSHDQRFLDRLTTRRWHISQEKGTTHAFKLQQLR